MRKLTLMEPLTKLELFELNKEIDQIEKILEITNDDDILENLDNRLNEICLYLEKSLNITTKSEKIKKIGLKLVG